MSTSTDTGYNAEGRGLNDKPSASYTNSAPTHVEPRRSTETKASFKTTELMAYIAAVVGVLIASAAWGPLTRTSTISGLTRPGSTSCC